MNKPMTRPLHGLAELTYIPAVCLAPKLGGFEENKTATTLCYAISGTALLSSLFTRAEWGAVRVIPFKMHLALDAVTGLLALGAPKLLGFENNSRARNAFLLMGLTALVVSALTQPDEMQDS
jgi:hypothetical protein